MSTVTSKTGKLNKSLLKKGSVVSETQYYIVSSVNSDSVDLVNDSNGEEITVGNDYSEAYLDSADQFVSEETKSRTELVQIFLAHPYTAMTVNFNKQVKKEDVTKEIQDAYENSTPKEFTDKMKKAVAKGLNGEERTMTGRHMGSQDEFGRVNFVDMEIQRDFSKDYDNRLRLVDPRTINWLIVKGVKYKVKK